MDNLNFKQWLNENANRTACKAYNYPMRYNVNGFSVLEFPLLNASTAGDMFTYLEMKPVKFQWTGFDKTKNEL